MRKTNYLDGQPPSWWLPCFDLSTEFHFFTNEVQRRARLGESNHWILKPAQGSRSIGHRIVIASDPEEILRECAEPVIKDSAIDRVAQLIVDKPVLFERRKFDLRLFVVVKSFAPLQGIYKLISKLSYDNVT